MIDPTFETMTDDQLNDYLVKVNTKLAMASRLAGGSGAVEQLQRLLNAARDQMTQRVQAKAFRQIVASQRAEIVTDPDLMPKVDPSPKKQKVQPHFKRIHVQRSDRPTSEVDLAPSPPAKDKTK